MQRVLEWTNPATSMSNYLRHSKHFMIPGQYSIQTVALFQPYALLADAVN